MGIARLHNDWSAHSGRAFHEYLCKVNLVGLRRDRAVGELCSSGNVRDVRCSGSALLYGCDKHKCSRYRNRALLQSNSNSALTVTLPVTGSFDYHGFVRTIVGSFITSAPRAQYGFLRYSSGSITTIQVSGSSSTVANSINANDWVTGSYKDAAGTHGFVWTP